MTRIPSRKDSLASFILTVGAADMVIGGVGDRGSLFALGLLTAVSAMVIRWLRQRRRSVTAFHLSANRRNRSRAGRFTSSMATARHGSPINRGHVANQAVANRRQAAPSSVWQQVSGPPAGQQALRRKPPERQTARLQSPARPQSSSTQVSRRQRYTASLDSPQPLPATPGTRGASAQSPRSQKSPEERKSNADSVLQRPPLNLPPPQHPRNRRQRR